METAFLHVDVVGEDQNTAILRAPSVLRTM